MWALGTKLRCSPRTRAVCTRNCWAGSPAFITIILFPQLWLESAWAQIPVLTREKKWKGRLEDCGQPSPFHVGMVTQNKQNFSCHRESTGEQGEARDAMASVRSLWCSCFVMDDAFSYYWSPFRPDFLVLANKAMQRRQHLAPPSLPVAIDCSQPILLSISQCIWEKLFKKWNTL